MSRLSKKLLPRFLVHLVLSFSTNLLIIFYKIFNGPLKIRRGTSDHMVFRDIFLFKEFKLPVAIDPKLIIDLGAYTGLSTKYFTIKYPNAKIVSVEPECSNFELLKYHTIKNPQVSLINAGVWSTNGYLRITNIYDEKWAFSVQEVRESEDYDVKSITIKSILEKSGFDRIDILKVDIEGAERNIFSMNYTEWIGKVNVIIIELHDRIVPGCSEALYNTINLDDWIEYKRGEKVVLVRK